MTWNIKMIFNTNRKFYNANKVELKEYTQTCTIVALEGESIANDPKRLLFWSFVFPALLVIVASNVVIYMKIRTVPMNKRRTSTYQKNRFILMLFLAFLAWLFSILPFIIVDTVLDSCFQVIVKLVKPFMIVETYFRNLASTPLPTF